MQTTATAKYGQTYGLRNASRRRYVFIDWLARIIHGTVYEEQAPPVAVNAAHRSRAGPRLSVFECCASGTRTRCWNQAGQWTFTLGCPLSPGLAPRSTVCHPV